MGGIKILKYSLAVLLGLLCACTSSQEQWQPEKGQKIFRIATRQVPPAPVYGALRWVRPPQVMPSRKIEGSDAQLIRPIIQFEVTDRPICEAALVLAAAASYHSYCSSQIAQRRLTLGSIGTLEELAAEIEKGSGIRVAIDHPHKEVRFLSNNYVAPKL